MSLRIPGNHTLALLAKLLFDNPLKHNYNIHATELYNLVIKINITLVKPVTYV